MAGCLLLSLSVLSANPALAAPRDDTLAALEDLERATAGTAVRVRVLGESGEAVGQDVAVRIGQTIRYRFESSTAGYLTALHVDTHGAATLFYPRVDPEEGRLDGAGAIELPSAEDGFALEAQPPIGRDVIYAIVTPRPIHRRDLQIDSRSPAVSFEPHEAPGFVTRLRRVVEGKAGGEIQVARATQQIDGRGDVLYRSADIVDFFGGRTRGLRPPKLDLQIHFASDSADLDDKARRNIDEFAAALGDPKLASVRFKVAGHTDDTGSEAHNLGLSRRRAESVRRYLVEEAGIPGSRLEIEAHGENVPLMGETTDYARQMNRRVEFMPAR